MPKGTTNNPNGRPPKNRALSEILQQTGSKRIEYGGRTTGAKRLLAELAWQGATSGRVVFDGERIMDLDADQWLGLVKFIYGQIDGPPKQVTEVTGEDGGAIHVVIKYADS